MQGKDVFFAVGTDENSQKSVEAASAANVEAVQTYVNEMSAVWKQTWDALDMTNTDFIRTTEPRHLAAVVEFYNRSFAKGDIYKSKYVGLYCVGCEAYKKPSDLDDSGKCPDHARKPKELKEENYFFKLTKYREPLLKYIEDNPEFIQPKSRRNEIVNYVKDNMEDISISRKSQDWGIPVPNDDSQVLYVWFDALINYISIIGFATDDELFAKYWPADLHIVGKDITKFHCALWPAMLMSADIELPNQVYAHGFFTIDGQKMSKTLGNVIDPADVGTVFGLDALRYFLIREIKFGEDGDFSLERLKNRYHEDLANELGNLASRILKMIEQFAEGKIPEGKGFATKPSWDEHIAKMETKDFFGAIEHIWSIIRDTNKSITENKPWELAKSKDKELDSVLYYLADTLYHLAWLLHPITPDTSAAILTQLGCDMAKEHNQLFSDLQTAHVSSGQQIGEITILFPKVE